MGNCSINILPLFLLLPNVSYVPYSKKEQDPNINAIPYMSIRYAISSYVHT